MERKIFVVVALVISAIAFSSCEKDGGPDVKSPELRVLTFEDEDVQFEEYGFSDDSENLYFIASWSDLIPDEQYGDAMLYGSAVADYDGWSGYFWCDANNTLLYSGIEGDKPIYWNGGQAISDYYSATIEGATYFNQLEVATGKAGAAGHNGSKNFCVNNSQAEFSFRDGEERVVDHMYVTNTAYTLSSLIYGDAYSAAAGDDSWLKIVATGYNRKDEQTGVAEFLLCNGKEDIVTSWELFDLTSLDAVVRMRFHLEGSADLCGEWGLNTPTYFAFDDVAVHF